MYRRVLIISAILVSLTSATVRAEDQSSLLLTDTQIAQVSQRCVQVQSVLFRLRANDGLRRVTLGRQYETISTKLMAPLNSRIAINKLDGVELTKTTVDFNKQLDDFRAKYQTYEQAVSNLIGLKCKDQPVTFYDGIIMARDQRSQVRVSVEKLNTLLTQYNTQFDELSRKIHSGETTQ